LYDVTSVELDLGQLSVHCVYRAVEQVLHVIDIFLMGSLHLSVTEYQPTIDTCLLVFPQPKQ